MRSATTTPSASSARRAAPPPIDALSEAIGRHQRNALDHHGHAITGRRNQDHVSPGIAGGQGNFCDEPNRRGRLHKRRRTIQSTEPRHVPLLGRLRRTPNQIEYDDISPITAEDVRADEGSVRTLHAMAAQLVPVLPLFTD